MMTGYPISSAKADATDASEIGSDEPFAVGNPAASMAALASILSPRSVITSALGPINVIPSCSSLFTKPAFSARKPYPG